MKRLLDKNALEKEKGIKFSDTHLWRLIRSNKFPRPVKIGSRLHWTDQEIDAYVAAKLAERDRSEVA
jgi:prophage regulatory protein